jgi:hydrogenase-4 component F
VLAWVLIIPFATAAAAMIAPGRRGIEAVNTAGAVIFASVSLSLVGTAVSARTVELFNMTFRVDALSAFILSIIVLITVAVAFYSVHYMGREFEQGETDLRGLRNYYGLLHLFIFTMTVAAAANNLAVFWIAIEGTTLVSALLVGFYRNRQSVEAAWKYVILCTVSIGFALLGVFLTYYASSAHGGKGTLLWSEIVAHRDQLNPVTLKLAFIFILIGYGAKAGLAPVHNWLPDAHSQAPTPVSALLSGVLLKCAMLGILRFIVLTGPGLEGNYSGMMMLSFGLLSMGIAAAFILLQQNYKRLLAYSSIEHIGIVAAGIGIGGVLGVYGALLHMLNHAIVKTLLFFTTGEVRLRYKSTKIENVRGVFKSIPVSGTVMLLAAMAIAGVPPFNIFISEFTILKAAAAGANWIAFTLFLVFVTVIFGGILYHFGRMAFGDPGAETEKHVPGVIGPAVIIVLGLAALLLGLHIPRYLDSLLSEAAHVVIKG